MGFLLSYACGKKITYIVKNELPYFSNNGDFYSRGEINFALTIYLLGALPIYLNG